MHRLRCYTVLAKLPGISADFLSLVERGRNAPSFETRKLRVHVTVLFDFGGQDRPAIQRKK